MKYDVVIVGGGIFGCLSALELAQEGVSVCVVDKNSDIFPYFSNSLKVFWPTPNELPTRSIAAHGLEMAQVLHQIPKLGIDFFPSELLTSLQPISCLRVAAEIFEKKEIESALEYGFQYINQKKTDLWKEENAGIFCLNEDNFIKIVKDKLLQLNISFIKENIVALEENASSCLLIGSKINIESEIVVLSGGSFISHLLPKYKHILLPMTDLFCSYLGEFNEEIFPMALRTSNGHMGAVFSHNKFGKKGVCAVTGPRFLLPMAGVGNAFSEDILTPEMKAKLTNIHKKIFNYGSFFPFGEPQISLGYDCLPCDELPLLGEYGRCGRVLGFAGCLGYGYSAGVWASRVIKDLILFQKSSLLPELFQPRRFFRTRFN